MATCPTVRIVNPQQPDSYIVINESDFDPSVHVRVDNAPLEPAGQAVSGEGPSPKTDTGDTVVVTPPPAAVPASKRRR